ncbi:methyltransferase domain-containing protein [soil metagenome]
MPAGTAIHKWLRTPLGQDLRVTEEHVVSHALEQVFGLQLLQIGDWGKPGCLLSNARTQRKAMIGDAGGTILGDPTDLGIASDSIDAALLPHTLELSEEPHRVLREAERVLCGEGCLIVLGFNPYGSWGLRRALSRGRFPPGIAQFISERRIRDWLKLLGFEIECVRHYLFAPPFRRRSSAREPERIGRERPHYQRFLAAGYLVKAKKHVYTLTPIRPRRLSPRKVMGGLIEPSAFRPHCARDAEPALPPARKSA